MTDTYPWFRYSLKAEGQFLVTWWVRKRNARGTSGQTPYARKFATLDLAIEAASDLGPAREVTIMDTRVRLLVPRIEFLRVARERDHAWSEALRGAFGAEAGNARFDERGTSTPELKALWVAKRNADRVAGL